MCVYGRDKDCVNIRRKMAIKMSGNYVSKSQLNVKNGRGKVAVNVPFGSRQTCGKWAVYWSRQTGFGSGPVFNATLPQL
jgi:hypothetical protein